MKCKNLLILSSVFVSNADLPESMVKEVQKLGSTNASLGRIEVSYKGFFYSNLLLVGGFDMSFNPFFGVGYIQNMEYMGWPIEFKFILYCFDWANKSLSQDYFSKMPLSVSASTNIWGFNVGAAVSFSSNKKFLISAFVKFNLNDEYDVAINYHAYGESDFFSKNSFSRSAIERLKKDSHKIVSDFAGYCKKNVPGEVQDEIIDCFIQHAKQTERICDYYLGYSKSLKSIKDAQSKSLFLIGKSGAGKTNTFALFQEFVDGNKLHSISLISLNASTFTPEGYKGDNINDKISELFNSNIKNSKDYKHNAVSIFRSIILVDEIDNISERNGGSDSDNFYTRVQKAMLDFVEGLKVYKTDVGLIPIAGCLKILPGAFESKSGELERTVLKKVLFDKEGPLTKSLINSLIDYIKANYITKYSDCEKSFNTLLEQSEELDNLIITELDKDPNFTALKRGDKDKDLRSIDEIYKFLDYNKVFSSLKNPEVSLQIQHVANLVKNLKKKLTKIQIIKTKEEISIDYTKFEDLYIRIIEKLESFESDLDERPNEILEVAVENYKRKNALFCISESGMGGEIIRRAATVFYLEKPSFLRSLKFLEQSNFAKLLKKNKKNIVYLGLNSDDGEDRCFRALLQSIRGGKANNNAKYSFSNLEELSDRAIKDFERAIDVNGKVVIVVRNNGIYVCPDDLGDVNIKKVEDALNEGLSKIDKEIKNYKTSLESLNNSSSIQDYDKILEILNNENTEKSFKDLKLFFQEYQNNFLNAQQFKAFCSSMLKLVSKDQFLKDSFGEFDRMSKIQELVEGSSDFFKNLNITNIIDDSKSSFDLMESLENKCKECQKKADSQKLLNILTILLKNIEKKNILLNEKKTYKKGFNQTIKERIVELAKNIKNNKQEIIDLYYEIISLLSKK